VARARRPGDRRRRAAVQRAGKNGVCGDPMSDDRWHLREAIERGRRPGVPHLRADVRLDKDGRGWGVRGESFLRGRGFRRPGLGRARTPRRRWGIRTWGCRCARAEPCRAGVETGSVEPPWLLGQCVDGGRMGPSSRKARQGEGRREGGRRCYTRLRVGVVGAGTRTVGEDVPWRPENERRLRERLGDLSTQRRARRAAGGRALGGWAGQPGGGALGRPARRRRAGLLGENGPRARWAAGGGWARGARSVGRPGKSRVGPGGKGGGAGGSWAGEAGPPGKRGG
jgi:hypothetical protein